MRIALVQLDLDYTNRSATVQGLGAAVGRAADTSPAPVLVILPGGCDAECTANRAVLESVKEAISHQAREWGVYVAVGLHTFRDESPEPCALLFDTDGDIVARSPRRSEDQQTGAESPLELHCSPYGVIGVVEPTVIDNVKACHATSGFDGVIAVPMPRATAGRSSAATRNVVSFHRSIPTESKSHWAVVHPAGGKSESSMKLEPVASFLRAPSGSLLAAAENREETILFADVPIAPSPSENAAPIASDEITQTDLTRDRASGGLP